MSQSTTPAPAPIPFPPGFDPADQEFRRNPYPVYERLRAEGPTHVLEPGKVLFTGYAEVMQVLREAQLEGDLRRWPYPWMSERKDSRLVDLIMHMLFARSDSYHHRLRRLLMAAFTPRAVEQTQPTIDRVVARLLTEVAELDEFDLVTQVAQRIPSEVMCEMLDFPLERREWAAERVLGMSRTLDPDISPAEVDALAIGLAEVEEYMLPVVAERRRDPADDLMSGLTQATVDGELLTDTEIIANIILLFLAGQSTTRSLISNAVVELFRHPDQMELLRSDPTLDRAAAEEFLRFVGTIQMLSKRALGPVTIDDVKFEEGDQAMIVLASANRDVKAYADPERMDLRRFAEGSQPPMASFGFGLHYCLGANLARMEVAAIVPPLVRSFPGLQMPDQVLTYPGFSNRGPNHVRLLTR